MVLSVSWPTELPSGNPIEDTRRIFAGIVNPGVLSGGKVSGVAGRMAYSVAAFVVATQRIAGGVELVANDGPLEVATTAAPASGSRIDVVWVKSNFNLYADSTSTPEIGVTQGVAGTSPTRPSIPDGATPLAVATVTSSMTNTASAAIAPGGAASKDLEHFLPYSTLAALQANGGAVKGQHAIVNGDPNAALNGDYTWSGTAWVQANPAVRTVTCAMPFGAPNWPAPMRLERRGNLVQMSFTYVAAFNAKSGTATEKIPVGFRPNYPLLVTSPTIVSGDITGDMWWRFLADGTMTWVTDYLTGAERHGSAFYYTNDA